MTNHSVTRARSNPLDHDSPTMQSDSAAHGIGRYRIARSCLGSPADHALDTALSLMTQVRRVHSTSYASRKRAGERHT